MAVIRTALLAVDKRQTMLESFDQRLEIPSVLLMREVDTVKS